MIDIQVIDGKTFEQTSGDNTWHCPFCGEALYVSGISPKVELRCLGVNKLTHVACTATSTARDIESAYDILLQVQSDLRHEKLTDMDIEEMKAEMGVDY